MYDYNTFTQPVDFTVNQSLLIFFGIARRFHYHRIDNFSQDVFFYIHSLYVIKTCIRTNIMFSIHTLYYTILDQPMLLYFLYFIGLKLKLNAVHWYAHHNS